MTHMQLAGSRAVATAQDDWDRHWQDYSASNRLNPAQDFRRRVILHHLARLGNGAGPLRVLDIGCGTGEFLRLLLARYPRAECLGLEYSRRGVEIARRNVPPASFLQADLLQPQQPEPRFRAWATLAVCSEVLEHVDDPDRLLRNAQPYLAPGARLIVTVPGGPISAFDRYIGHRRHFTPAALADLLTAAGYEVRGAWGAGFPFFNLYRLAVIGRGERLVRDVASGSKQICGPALVAMRLFGYLFRLNSMESARGWQTVGLARYRAVTPPPRDERGAAADLHPLEVESSA